MLRDTGSKVGLNLKVAKFSFSRKRVNSTQRVIGRRKNIWSFRFPGEFFFPLASCLCTDTQIQSDRAERGVRKSFIWTVQPWPTVSKFCRFLQLKCEIEIEMCYFCAQGNDFLIVRPARSTIAIMANKIKLKQAIFLTLNDLNWIKTGEGLITHGFLSAISELKCDNDLFF